MDRSRDAFFINRIKEIFYFNKNIESLTIYPTREEIYTYLRDRNKIILDSIDAINEITTRATSLKKLNLTNLSLSAFKHGMKFFREFVNKHENLRNLEELNLYHRFIKDEGVGYLASMKLPNLTHLYLSTNNIEDEECEIFLQCNRKISSLNLGDNFIRTEGLRYLASAKVPSLKRLDLSNNSIDAAGMKVLASSEMPQLTDLNLFQCNVGDEGMDYLARMLLT